jgi:hypothetical protein
MLRKAVIWVLLSAAVPATVWSADRTVPSASQLAQEARRDFELTLDLWRDGRYEELYRRSRGDKESRESLVGRLAEAEYRPACCWEKLQNVEVSVKGEASALLHGTVGLEGDGSGTVYRTRQFRLAKEDGVWKVQRSDLASLAGARKGKKKRSS